MANFFIIRYLTFDKFSVRLRTGASSSSIFRRYQQWTAPLTVNFSNTSKNATQFQWDFGDGSAVVSSSALADPINHQYTKAGAYTVTLTAAQQGQPSSPMTLVGTITPGVISKISLDPASANLTIGQSQKFTASAFDAYDNPLPEA